MKIMFVSSKYAYPYIAALKEEFEKHNIETVLPNSYYNQFEEDEYRGSEQHASWKAAKFKESEEKIKNVDAVLVVNMEKNGVPNYIGGATFLEIYDAFRYGKKIYFLNPLPEGILKDELIGFSPVILNGKLDLLF